MSDSLILRPVSRSFHGDWELCLRTHDLSGTDYLPLSRLSMEVAYRVADAGAATWLDRSPAQMQQRQIEEASRA